MTWPWRPSASTTSSTRCSDGWLLKLTVSSVPPAKSMPSAKPRTAMEMMPGTMINSDSAKNRLRSPMMFRRRTRGAAAAAGAGGAGAAAGAGSASPSATMSAFCSSALTSDSSDTIHSEQACPPESGPRQHDREEVVGDDDRRDQDVGVDGHANGQDEAGDAGQRQSHRHDLEHRQHRARVEDQREAGQEPGQPVVDDHENDHDREAEQARRETELHRFRAERRADLRDVKRHEVDRERTCVDSGCQVRRALLREVAADMGRPARDLLDRD